MGAAYLKSLKKLGARAAARKRQEDCRQTLAEFHAAEYIAYYEEVPRQWREATAKVLELAEQAMKLPECAESAAGIHRSWLKTKAHLDAGGRLAAGKLERADKLIKYLTIELSCSPEKRAERAAWRKKRDAERPFRPEYQARSTPELADWMTNPSLLPKTPPGRTPKED